MKNILLSLPFVIAVTIALTTALHAKEKCPSDDPPFCRAYKLAQQGDAKAQFSLGLMYDFGKSVAEDDLEAVRWMRKAAEQGVASAQFNLGWMYHAGEGVAQDKREAVRWYRKAAEQGHAEAQGMLGMMYAEGEGVAVDKREAVRWYRKSAEQGGILAPVAQVALGNMYRNGEGVVDKRGQYAGIAKRQSRGVGSTI